jgi:P27 family predicted phage terminase small subunit
MNEPRPPEKIPKPPSWLCADAKRSWKKILPRLKEMRVLRQIDENALARYCTAWVRWRKACAFLAKRGETYMLKDEKGNPKCVMPFPELAIANKLATELLRLEQQFGMTPASRPNLEVAPTPVDYNDPYSLVGQDDNPYSLGGPSRIKRQVR